MPHGKPDPFLVNVRRALDNEKAKSAPITKFSSATFNHFFGLVVGAWGLDPQGPARPQLAALLDLGTTLGHCCVGGPTGQLPGITDNIGLRVEAFPTSHHAHDEAAIGPGLLISLREGDDDILSRFVRFATSDMAMLNLCATPAGNIVIAGARSHAAPGESGVDQRTHMANWRRVMHGTKIHTPATLKTADDLLGIYALSLLDAAAKQSVSWAQRWPKIKASIANAGPESLPVTYQPYKITRSSQGLVCEQSGVIGQLDPSWWAWTDFSVKGGNGEKYGLTQTPNAPKCSGSDAKVFATKTPG